MKPDEIKLSDWARIFAGDVPPAFYAELVIRAFFIYFLLMLSMRLMGKRMSTQISRLELTAMVALASAVGVPILAPDRGLVPPLLIAFIVVVITRTIAKYSGKNERFERATQGDADMLVEDGVIRFDVMRRIRITRELLFARLRMEQLTHLGPVRRVYMEADGNFSIVTSDEGKPGLSVLPEWDKEFQAKRHMPEALEVCRNCGIKKEGNLVTKKGHDECRNCGNTAWTNAVTTLL
jgi:uncharacterized membrane protein YcaP (DUF421 family)